MLMFGGPTSKKQSSKIPLVPHGKKNISFHPKSLVLRETKATSHLRDHPPFKMHAFNQPPFPLCTLP